MSKDIEELSIFQKNIKSLNQTRIEIFKNQVFLHIKYVFNLSPLCSAYCCCCIRFGQVQDQQRRGSQCRSRHHLGTYQQNLLYEE